MANQQTTDEIKLLFRTAVADADLKEVSKNVKNALENAAIGFNEAETKRNLTPIVRMIEKLFAKAEMKFDASSLLEMPSKDAFQKLANISADEFNTAFERALKNSGGLKIDFGNIDLSGVVEPLEGLASELSDISEKIANTTKKSVGDIEESIQRLNKAKSKKINTKVPVEGVSSETRALDKTLEEIELTLSGKNITGIKNTKKGTKIASEYKNETVAINVLKNARNAYMESVESEDPWEKQYMYLLGFVKKYEAVSEKIKATDIWKEHSEFGQLYNILSPKAGAAEISLRHFVDVANDKELTEYKNQPWARESTLKEVRDALQNGITVKEGSGGGGSDNNSVSPERVQGSTSLVSGASVDTEKAVTEQAKKTEEERLRLVEQRRIEEEKAADAARQAAEEVANAVAEPVFTELERQIIEAVEEAKSKTLRKWENTDPDTKERYIKEALGSRLTLNPLMDKGDRSDILFDAVDFSNGDIAVSEVAESFQPWIVSIEEEFEKADVEVKELVRRLAKIDDETSGEAWEVSEQILERNELLSELINQDTGGNWIKFKDKLNGKTPDATSNIQTEIVAHQQNVEAIREENEELKENIQLQTQANTHEGGAGHAVISEPDVAKEPSGAGGQADGVSSEELRNLLSAITYNVKFANDNANKEVNKIAIDENGLEAVLKRVFVNKSDLQPEQNGSEPSAEPWAREDTLGSVKEVLTQIQTNTAKSEQLEIKPAKTEVGNVLATESTLGAIKMAVESINNKVVKGTKVTTQSSTKTQSAPSGRDAQILTERIETQKLALKKFKTELEASGKMTEEMSKKIRGLAISLGMVKDGKGLTRWGQKFQQQKLSVGIADVENRDNIAEQNTHIKEWISLSKELGELDAKINSGLFDDKILLQAKQEREFVVSKINDVVALLDDQMGSFTQAGEANLEGHYSVVNEQKSKMLGDLVSQYEKLGELEAKAEASGAFVDREQYTQLQDEIQAETQKLGLNQEQHSELLQILQAHQEVAYISAKDIEYTKEQKRLFTEYVSLVKQVGKLDGTINSDVADPVAKQNAQMQKGVLTRLIDDIRPKLDLTEADYSSLWDANLGGEEQGAIIQRQKAFSELSKQYKDLGKWQAKAEVEKTQYASGYVSRIQEEIAEKQKSLNLSEEELAVLQKITEETKTEQKAALSDKVADKDAKKAATEAKKIAKSKAMTGKAGSAIGRAESVWLSAEGMDDALPSGLQDKVDALYSSMEALREEQNEVAQSPIATPEQQQNLRKHTADINTMTSEVSELLAEYQKLSGANVDPANVRSATLTANSSLAEYKNQMAQYVNEITNGQGKVKNFDATTKTLTYTVKTGANEFTEYTVALRRADSALVSVQGATKKTETFLEATQRKMAEISSYITGMGLLNFGKQQLQKGIQYIKEIDDAMTELRKVTDATEETYEKFMKTASKSADKLGSTMQEVISSTADFARLGYTLAQATELAESAQLLMNVSEFSDISSATDSLISIMKAFEYTVEESEHIVDILNIIGKQNCRCI